MFGEPKNAKDRWIPLPATVAAALKTHTQAPTTTPVQVTLPWEDPMGEDKHTARLVFTTTRGGALNRSTFSERNWHPALLAADLEPSRAAGMHALRHLYASALPDAGESVKALSSYLGHADPGFTLRIYTHLMPTSEDRTRRAIDDLFGPADGLETA